MKYEIPCYSIHNMDEGGNKIDDFSFDVIYTPGHKDDSISIYFKDEKYIFVGDFIFKNSIGRTDLAGGNSEDMKKSIKKFLDLDDNIVLFPGHYEKTTIGNERENLNYFMNII